MSCEPVAEFPLFTNPGRGIACPTSVTLDAREIRCTNAKGSGSLTYGDITSIELIVGDPDPGERTDWYSISTGGGAVLRVSCLASESLRKKDRPDRRNAYYLLSAAFSTGN